MTETIFILSIIFSIPVVGFIIIGFGWHIGEWFRETEQNFYQKRWSAACDKAEKSPPEWKSQRELIKFVEDLVGQPRGLEFNPLGGMEWCNGWTIAQRPRHGTYGKDKEGNPIPLDAVPFYLLRHHKDEAVFDLTKSNRSGFYKLRKAAMQDPQLQVSQERLHTWSTYEKWEFSVHINYPREGQCGLATESPVGYHARMRMIAAGCYEDEVDDPNDTRDRFFIKTKPPMEKT